MSATQTASRTTTALRRSMNLELQDDDAAHKGELAPLTSDMKREIYELKAAYEEFWQQRKFKKGWAKPLFAFDEAVEELLAQAAEIVVRIRSHFDELASGGVGTGAGVVLSKSAPALATHTKHLPRFKEGRAREHLWSLEQDPRAAPQQFVRDIVHATLSHEDGYLEEGLTADKVDRYIDKILAYMRQRDEQEAQATAQLEEKLKRRWDKTEKLLQTFCGLEADRKANKSYYGSLRKIIKRVDDVREELKLMLSRVDTNASRPQVEEERQASETPSAEAETQTEKGEPEATANVTVEDKASEVKEVEGEEKKDESREIIDGSVATTSSSKPETGEAETTETTESAQPAAAESEGTKPETTETVDSAQSEAAEPEDSASATPSEDEPVKQAEEGENKEESGDDNSISDEERQRIEQEKQKAMLKIKSVADSVTRLSDQIEGFASEATRLDVEELQKEPESAEKTLSRLQKQCLFYSENLMKDLLSLDAISTGSALQDEASDEVRPLRKQQVKEIQGLLQDVDQVNTKLKAMLKKIQDEKQRREEQRKKQEMDERAKQPQQQEQPQPPQQQQQQQEKEEEQQTNNLWRTLKLKPKFEMAQTADGIILQAYIPGMKEEDIEIERDDDGRTFTVKGLRVPTPAEEAALRRQLKSGLARDPWGLYYPQGEQERDLLLRLGAGRYGAFAETFEVGPEMDLYGITASYTKGVLRILVPAAAPAAGKPRRPRHHQQQAPYGQNPFFGGMPQQRRRQPAAHRGYGGAPQGFFDDKSFWW